LTMRIGFTPDGSTMDRRHTTRLARKSDSMATDLIC
jgi:hypothetical protein